MKKLKLQNLQSLETVDSISIMSAMDSGFLGSGNLGSGIVPNNIYPSDSKSFEYCVIAGTLATGSSSYIVKGNFQITNFKVKVYVSVKKPIPAYCTYCGSVIIKRNGKKVSEESLGIPTGTNISDADYLTLGTATLDMPKTGDVEIIIFTGQTINTGAGNVATNHKQSVYNYPTK